MRHKSVSIIVSVIVVALVLTAGFMVYNDALENSFANYSHNTLQEVMDQQRHSFQTLISERLSAIRALSKVLAEDLDDQKNNANLVKMLQAAMGDSEFCKLLLADLDGKALSSDNQVLDISQQDFFRQSKAGMMYVSEPMDQPVDDKKVVVFSTPIYSNGKIVAILAGAYDAKELGKVFASFYGKEGYTYIYTSQGELITHTSDVDIKQDAFALLNSATFIRYDNRQEILQKSKLGTYGHSIYRVNGKTRLLHYAPVGINDWFILTAVSDDAISRESKIIANNSVIFTVFIILVVAGILFFFIWRQKRSADMLYQIAYFDEMTGAPNMAKFKLEALKVLKSNPERRFYAMKFDVHQFKMINELYGMAAGDDVIRAISETISMLLTKCKCIFARINADEFIVLYEYLGEEAMTGNIELFEDEFAKVNLPSVKGHNIQFRYGRYIMEQGDCNVDVLLEKVNLAHRLAREQKQDVVFDYDDTIKNQLVRESELENMMEGALANEEFLVYLQPKYNINSESIVGAEALVRWKRNDEFVSYPNQFIPLFEKNGFILKLDMYMLRKVCEIIRGWMDDGKPIVTVSINFSRLHMERDSFVGHIEKIVNEYGIPRHYIEVELTENSMLGQEQTMHTILSKLHEAGFTLSIDDFGTGYSSLGLLKNLPVDTIKMDRSFFDNDQYKTRTKIVVESVIKMAKRLDVHIVAEGVEDIEHIEMLRDVGCDTVQGYYYARPMPASEFDVNNVEVPEIREREYVRLNYADIGDMSLGRGKVGADMPVTVYRLFQFALRAILKEYYGTGEMVSILRKTGRLAGSTFARESLDISLPLDGFIKQLSEVLESNRIGVLRVESFDPHTGKGVLSIYDDLDCSGITSLNETLCQYDEGFIAGILYEYTKKKYSVVEIECWGTGGNVCRFEVKPK